MSDPPSKEPDQGEEEAEIDSGDGLIESTLDDSNAEPTAIAAPAARRSRGSVAMTATPTTAPTQQLPGVSRIVQAPTGETGATRLSTAATPVEALRIEEVLRTHQFLKVALAIIVAIGIALPLIGGDPTAKWMVGLSLIPAAGSCLWLLARTREAADYSVADATIVAVTLSAAAYAGVFFWGIFSPGPALILLGIYFFSLGGSRQATLFVYFMCAAYQAILAGLIMTDVIADRGFIQADRMAIHEQIITQAIVQILYLCAYLVARSSRKATLDAVAQLEQAVRAVSQREALLLEARQDLDRALRIGGPGRFTDQRIGSFTLGVLIGRGGMGEVYEAGHIDTGEAAAIKLLHPHVLANPDHVRRFERELETAAKLTTPNVVKVLEVGRTEGDVPFLAMERLRGHDLAYHLRKRRRLSLAKTVTLIRQIGAGLAAAHEVGIVHRDIKPQNLFLAQQNGGNAVWKILDFGVSKLADHGGTLTKGHVVGTPGYMAPEQARGETVDHRADIYSLAAIAYRALTGRPPFSGKDLPTTLYDVVYSMPIRPSQLAELTEEIDLVLMVGMAKASADRFDSGDELADALATAGRGEFDRVMARRAYELCERHPWKEE